MPKAVDRFFPRSCLALTENFGSNINPYLGIGEKPVQMSVLTTTPLIGRTGSNCGENMHRAQTRWYRNTEIRKLNAIDAALGSKDPYTQGHARRVALYAMRLARRIGLPVEDIGTIGIGGLLHDIGKMGLHPSILRNEEEQLCGEMREAMRRHPEIGVALLKGLDFIDPILDYVRLHHERMDGSGYPFGLKDDEIPLGVKIISVADCFDAITTDRPYQKHKTRDEAFAILLGMAGNRLCPELVNALIEDVRENGVIDA